MSIERMKRMWVVTERTKLRPMLDALASLQSVHLVEVTSAETSDDVFSHLAAETAKPDERIARLQHIREIMDHYQPPKRGLGENFVALPLEITADEMSRALEEFDVDAIDGHITDLADEALALSHRIEEIHIELAHLTLWEGIDCAAPPPFRRCVGALGAVSHRMRALMDESEKVGDTIFINELGRGKNDRALLQVVALAEHENEFNDFLRQFEFNLLPLAPGVSAKNMARALTVELDGYGESIAAIDAAIAELVEKHRRGVIAVLGHWEARRDVAAAQEKALNSRRMVMLTGYVCAREAEVVRAKIGETFPEADVVFKEPELDEDVPVQLRTNRIFEPAQALTSMFGLPHYRAFDPSPFLMLSFLVFFGFCFGDAVYGFLLLALSWYIIRKVKAYPGYRHFFTLIAWGGFFAMVVGILTGSWASDLPTYLGENNAVLRMTRALTVAEPLEVPARALIVVLGIGVINQFYGILLAMYRDFRVKDYAGAIFDGGLWLIVLPGFIMMIMGLFSPPIPAWVPRTGVWLFLIGAVGLFLTQGRKEESIAGKIVIGLVSIYGIMGSYGATGFVGDTLSYSRLLALGLVTAVVGMCFNKIAGIVLGQDPAVWQVLLFVLLVLIGHGFNFLINVLGSFVHSGRLIFMEFFGRFYEAGGVRFSPLGTSERVRVVD